jgi:hypothetical protein
MDADVGSVSWWSQIKRDMFVGEANLEESGSQPSAIEVDRCCGS